MNHGARRYQREIRLVKDDIISQVGGKYESS